MKSSRLSVQAHLEPRFPVGLERALEGLGGKEQSSVSSHATGISCTSARADRKTNPVAGSALVRILILVLRKGAERSYGR